MDKIDINKLSLKQREHMGIKYIKFKKFKFKLPKKEIKKDIYDHSFIDIYNDQYNG